MKADLHCHSCFSDGALNPQQLIAKAQAQGLALLAITDHDTLDGYLSVCSEQRVSGAPLLIPGVEFSCVWSGVLIHVVGLAFDIDASALQEGLRRLHQARVERMHIIAGRLDKLGLVGSLEAVQGFAGNGQPGRPHFARFLVEQGYVKNHAQAFSRYLGAGKMGDVKTLWPALREVVGWIRASGGVAVLAHPLYYKMTATKLRALLGDFCVAGGQAMEVVSGVQQADQTRYMARLCQQFGLHASLGSDFHAELAYGCDLGAMAGLPAECTPVWALWDSAVR